MSSLTPVVGCFVTVPGFDGRFRVEAVDQRGETAFAEIWNGELRQRVPVQRLRNGFRHGDSVQDQPYSRTHRPLGEGRVLRARTLGGADQVLVEFDASGKRVWLPFEYLKKIRAPEERLALGKFEPGLAERFRLRNLAVALEHWNENTGALSHLEVDPLPHQLHLVHHILASGTLNWLIADDVGLGKTIEVGMLLSALEQRRLDRVLIVCPAGLTRQWQEELAMKFHMDDFVIYGRDFRVHDPSHWPLYRHVIASMDLLKHESHLPLIGESGHWDVVVFDEAHRLSRRQWGQKLDATERYRLAQTLRNLTDNLLLLTATPHQGHHDRFVALLELLRPEWRQQLLELQSNPDVLRECVYRNRKADVTDADGEFIFHGQSTVAIEVPVGELESTFDRSLQHYVREGYAAAERRGQTGVAIGFVMTTFRKLAASSHAAILASLRARLAALELGAPPAAQDADMDARFEGEAEEASAAAVRDPFFEGEVEMLTELIALAEKLVVADKKLAVFADELIPRITAERTDEKVLVFTEYRGTQAHIVAALRARYGDDSVDVIHGSMSVDEKRDAVKKFGAHVQFLVSTEAGGEGLNLHERCHVMVNYDLPWNPMRLVQRVGRLHRYGQQQRVVVFNLHAPATLDARVIESMYDRIDAVVEDLAELSDEYHDGLRDEIFGELAALVDVDAVLAESASEPRTDERVRDALERARRAYDLHGELLRSVRGYDPDEMSGALSLGKQHLRSFVLGMLEQLGCEVRGEVRGGEVVDVLLAESIAARLGRPRTVRVVFSRRYQSVENAEMMGFASSLFQLLVEEAKRHEFNGSHACIHMPSGESLVTGILRWQDGQGAVMREEFVAALVEHDGSVRINPDAFSEWLASAQADAPAAAGDGSTRAAHVVAAKAAMEDRLEERSNRYLQPSQLWCFGAAWIHEGAR